MVEILNFLLLPLLRGFNPCFLGVPACVKDLAGWTDSFRSFPCYVCVRHDEKFVWGGRTEAKGLFLSKELLCASFLRLFVHRLESLL